MNTIPSIHQIIEALMELEAKGCHSVYFEYGNALFRVRIYTGDAPAGKLEYEKNIHTTQEHAEFDALFSRIQTLKNRVWTTVFQCYRQELVKGEKAGKWEKVKPVFQCGENAMYSMLCDGSGYYIDDPENHVRYFVDTKQISETNEQ